MTNDTAIKLENVSKFYKLYDQPRDRLREALHPLNKKYYKKFYALSDINLTVKKGEILGIVGKNGSGKSTLLKLASKILTPSEGVIEVNGSISAILELSAGFNPKFSGLENIYFYGTILGFTREEIAAKVDEIIEFTELGGFIHQPLRKYSSGMKARLAFAVSTSVNPDILILDEVLSVGDELFKRKCFARMESFFKSGKTVLYVSHSTQSVLNLCTTALMLDKGELKAVGETKDVVIQYEKLLFGSSKKESSGKESNNGSPKNTTKTQPANKLPTTNQTDKLQNDGDDGSYYLEKLVTKSKRVYKDYDVDIEDIYFENSAGKRINVLQQDKEYTLNYIAKFNMAIEKVSFAMCFLTKNGIVLGFSGGLNSLIEHDINAQPDDRYKVSWQFSCNIIPGMYFANVQVNGNINGAYVSLIDIKDAIAFKVFYPNKNIYGGKVHFFQTVSCEKLVNV